MTPRLSIVIPTCKRASILARCLEHVEKQSIVNQIETIVVSDGDDADTAELFKNRTWKMHTTFIAIPKSHQGVARNKGVALAKANRTLYIGDDIFLDPHACERHAMGEYATLGFTTWDPELEITPVMKWLETSGWQFGYPKIERYKHDVVPADMQPFFTYTSHISLQTSVAKAHPFREDVSLYGWEDMEWGLRLKNAGVRLFYEPDAKAYHHHPMTLEQSLKRMETIGKSAIEIEKINPALHVVPRGLKKLAYSVASMPPTMSGRHRAAFLRGIGAAN